VTDAATIDAERRVELAALAPIDSSSAIEFDAVTTHLCALFDVPKCTIALLDRDRLWFKSRIGIVAADTPLDGSFGSTVISSKEPVFAEDTLLDERFKSLSVVTGSAGIRFYAGVPLMIKPGVAIGSLAVMDTKPRKVTDQELAMLVSMGQVVVALLKVHKLAAESEQRRRALELREGQFKQTETIAQLGGWDWELATDTVTWSDEVYRIHEIPVGAKVTSEIAMSVYKGQERTRLEALFQRCLQERSAFNEVFRIVSLNGTEKWLRLSGDVEVVNGQVVRLFGIAQDVTESHDASRRLLEAANTDALTGLANRHSFTTRLESCFETVKSGSEHGLLMIDVDHLKEVNDTMGHGAGDVLIKTVACRLVDCIEPHHAVARIGGDEFAIIVENAAGPETLTALADRVMQNMRPRIEFAGRTIAPQVSMGLAMLTSTDTPESVRQKADIALYHAKEARRGGFVHFTESLRSTMSTRMESSRFLDEALAEGRVVAHYQPIVNLRTGRIEGVEALARVRMPEGCFRSAGEFISALDDSRNAVRLTTAILRNVTSDMARWKAAGVKVGRVGINATTADFRDGDLDRRIFEAFAAAGLPPSMATIEVTETVFLSQVAAEVSRTLHSLRSHGVKVALDDFGTGHASLANLGTLPVDIIKIDRTFVSRMSTHKISEAIVKALIDLGEVLDIAVVAEGVETEEQLLRLQRMGCNAGQGYLFSRPLTANDVTDFTAAFNGARNAPVGRPMVHFVA
jgi:diguanylate cyclase (GGDEF)-like protein